ncbi:MAG: toll/interleukin-1 receptor domain-containing protein [Lachnospiraceae bacterium]|nr:toll/interleukin-1 receptor domain-containing protein [Lachnospiraceae bacterium]
MEEEKIRYSAFISYRHCEPDKSIAKALHRKLENYRIPKGLRKKLGREHIGRVFRDEAELPVTDNLSDAILDALENSEYLIVICSPRLKLSAWCMKEIEIFTKLHGQKKILPVLIVGEPGDSFPESFFYEEVRGKDSDGKEISIRRDTEPLAADCRAGHKALDDTVIKLAAAMFKLHYDDLKQRHRAEKLRKRTILSAVIFAVLFTFLVQALVFLNTIQKQKRDLEAKYADSCAQSSEELLKKGNRMDALYAARSVLPDDQEEYVSADAYRALASATQLYDREIYVPKRMITAPVLIGTSGYSLEGSYVLTGNGSLYYLLETAGGEALYSFSSEEAFAAFYGEEGLAYSTGEQVLYYDIGKRETTVLLDTPGIAFSSKQGNIMILCTEQALYGYRGRERLFELSFADVGIELTPEQYYIECLFPEREDLCLMEIDDYGEENHHWILQLNTESGKAEACLKDVFDGFLYGMSTDGKEITVLVEDTSKIGSQLLLSYDIEREKVVKSTKPGEEIYTGLYFINGRFVLRSVDRIEIRDTDLGYLASFSVPMYPQDVFSIDGQTVVRNLNGELYSADADTAGMELTENYFGRKEAEKLTDLQYLGGKFYIRYMDQDGIVVYEKAQELACTECEAPPQIPSWDDSDELACREAFEQLEGFDMYLYQSGTRSSDGKYHLVCLGDNSVCIYDAGTMEKVKTIYGMAGYIYQFLYLEQYDCYALVTGRLEIFDSKLEHMLTVEDVWEMYEDPADGGLYIGGSIGKWYRIRLYSYKEMLDYADELLGDYVPSGRIREKYGL